MRGVFPFGSVHVWDRGNFPKFEGKTDGEIRCPTEHISKRAGKYGFWHPPPYVQAANCAILFGLKENTACEEAKSSRAFFEERIRDLEVKIHHVQIPDNQVALGRKVVIREYGNDDEETYTIVGTKEIDPSNGRISNESPIGEAVIGRTPGDVVRVKAPAGEIEFEIISVEC
jgi:transcription elongation factor GreA